MSDGPECKIVERSSIIVNCMMIICTPVVWDDGLGDVGQPCRTFFRTIAPFIGMETCYSFVDGYIRDYCWVNLLICARAYNF
jgi:hypothetical protein